jgi:hypothetical protein
MLAAQWEKEKHPARGGGCFSGAHYSSSSSLIILCAVST